MAGEKEERQQAHAAQQRPQHDLAALQGDMAGHDAVEAEQQQTGEKTEEKTAVLGHKDASCA